MKRPHVTVALGLLLKVINLASFARNLGFASNPAWGAAEPIAASVALGCAPRTAEPRGEAPPEAEASISGSLSLIVAGKILAKPERHKYGGRSASGHGLNPHIHSMPEI